MDGFPDRQQLNPPVFVNRKVAHVPHQAPGDIRVGGNDLRRHVSRRFPDHDQVSYHRVNGLGVALKILELHAGGIGSDLG